VSARATARASVLLVLATALVWLTACASTIGPRAAIDMQAAPETVDPAYAAADWAVLQWALTNIDRVEPFDRVAANERRRLAGLILFEVWAQQVDRDYAFLRFADGDIVVAQKPKSLRVAREALHTLEAPVIVRPDRDAVLGKIWATRLGRSGFVAWLDAQRHLELPRDTYGNVSRAATRLRRLLYAEVINEVVRQVDLDIAAGRFREAERKLRAELRNYPGDTELTAQLERLGAATIRGELAAARSKHLTQVRSAQTRSARAAALDAIEAELRERERDWLRQPHLAAGLKIVEPDYKRLQRDVAAARGKLWRTELERLATAHRHWHVFETLQARLKQAKPYPVAMAVVLEEELWAAFLAQWQPAIRHMLAAAQVEMEDGERYGTALLLCRMIEEMSTFASAHDRQPDADTRLLLQRTRDFRQQARAFFDTWVGRKIVLQPFTAGDAGLGTTIVRDLENLITRHLDEGVVIYGVSVAGRNHEQRPRDYVIAKGHVAAFEVNTAEPLEEVSLITRRGPIARGLNPEYEKRMKRRKSVHGIPPKVLLQEVYTYTRVRRELKSVVHARITFSLNHQGDGQFHEINRFLERTFVREAIDEQRTQVKRVVVPTMDSQQDAPPTLKRETPWVAAKMKDWARRQNEQLIARRILREVAAYPNQLAARAEAHEKRREWQMAANLWGFCHEYCSRIRPDAAALTEALEQTEVDYLRQALAADRDVHLHLQELQQSVRAKALAAARALLKEAE
jgi:hypothetical protein